MAKSKQVGLRLDDEAFERLQSIAERNQWSQAKVVASALASYETGSQQSIPADALKQLMEEIKYLKADNAEVKQDIDELRTICVQILKNQQADVSDSKMVSEIKKGHSSEPGGERRAM